MRVRHNSQVLRILRKMQDADWYLRQRIAKPLGLSWCAAPPPPPYAWYAAPKRHLRHYERIA